MNFMDPNGRGIRLDQLWLYRDQIPSLAWIVHGLIPVGFSILAGREKSGKSLMMFGSIAMAVALGISVFGVYPTDPGVVLYLALEEGLPTIASRMERLFSTTDEHWYPPANVRLYLGDKIDSFTGKGIDQLEGIIQSASGVKLVVIDTLRLLAPPKRIGASSTDYDHEYEIGSLLQKLALKHNIAIVALHHTTKTQYQDIFDSIGGTAWTKAAEMLAVLEREGTGAKLHVRGRSLPTTVSTMVQDPDSLRWTMNNDGGMSDHSASKKRQSEIGRIEVCEVFADTSKLRYTEIIKRFKSLELSEGSARRWLVMKVDEGTISKCPDGSGYEQVQPSPSDHHQHSLWDVDGGGSMQNALPPSHDPMANGGGGSSNEFDDEIDITNIFQEAV